MNQRLIAACIAVPGALALIVYANLARLPYATYSPAGTVDVLGSDSQGTPIVDVSGHKTYRDDGELRMTTVSVTSACADDACWLPLSQLIGAWTDGDKAVYPYDAVHAPEETAESSRAEGALQMATSQDSAVEVAMREMGIDVPQVVKVAALTEGKPAVGKLEVGDVLRTVDGAPVSSTDELVRLITRGDGDEAVRLGIERDGDERTVEITPVVEDGRRLIGITPGLDYDFPFEVKLNISPNIGGPSAGLMFSLAVYDTLTPGSLTGGRSVAGTGEIAPDGTVGPIGGIQQKIAGAREAGAQLFLVPEENCADALAADNAGDMRLMMARTMHEVRVALDEFADDPAASLPSCEDAR
ncbi:PDZ domain-containing protein [Nocardioides sp. R-C-SC26]|uniref:YlbL family protein n=1 Tax=Nocardioides sp. R-C-SC26 TaxID=2870414 RepID=UPI001E61864D|nr:PDZ domain-containing protein [Nocardioides sp. R-C-SC26]